jgi:hypothetical protein
MSGAHFSFLIHPILILLLLNVNKIYTEEYILVKENDNKAMKRSEEG